MLFQQFLLFVIAVEQSMAENVCIWNATTSSYVNGLYVEDGTSQSGYPSYTLQVPDSCNIGTNLYLFNSIYSTWTISTLKDNVDSGEQGVCASNQMDTPNQCNGIWQIPYGTPQTQVISPTQSKCYNVLCDQLSIHYDVFLSTEPCIGHFDNKIQDNVYQKGTSNIYLYFNPSLFRWVCGNKDGFPNQCTDLSSLLGYAKNKSWYNAHEIAENGEVTSIKVPWTNNHIATITCLQTHIPTQPTVSTTYIPTPVAAPHSQTEQTEHKKLTWWMILLIVVGSVVCCCGCAVCGICMCKQSSEGGFDFFRL